MYRMMERCPFAIPRYVERKPNQSVDQWKIDQGYQIDSDGVPEAESAYTERMSGILSLLGAIMQSSPTVLGAANPYGIDSAWLWTASVLNIRPQPITPYLICSFLDSAGFALLLRYGESFVKLLRFIRDNYLAMIPAGSISAKTRLEIYVSRALARRPPSIDPPPGSHLLP